MRSAKAAMLAACLWSLVLAGLPAGPVHAADVDLLDMIVELVSGSDSDLRVLGLQQIREEAPGKTATRRFAGLLPKLAPEMQVPLIDALSERGDVAARPAVLEMLNSETAEVRAMAARALARLGNSDDVPALARIAATGADVERKAARESLKQLRARKVDDAIVKALKDADAMMRVELIAALIARDAKDSLPRVLTYSEDPGLAVRLAVLDAARAMADQHHTAEIVKMLKSAGEPAERRQAERALLATCSRGGAKCADAVIDGFDGADAPTRMSLVRSLSEVGGEKALKEVVSRLKDEDEDVRGAAVRMLTAWPDPAAAPYLKDLAGDINQLRDHVLAIRGLVRLAAPGKDRPADLAMLGEAMQLASRTQEKILVLGTLGTLATPEALTLVSASLDQPELREDAAFAAVNIAEKIDSGDKDERRALMQRIADTVEDPATRDRAKTVLEAL